MSRVVINTSSPNDGLGATLRAAITLINAMTLELYSQKVDKEAGKGLSSNDFTTLLQAKLNAIAAGAEVNVQADLLQNDETADDYVKGKELFFSLTRQAAQVETYAGTSVFTLPLGTTVDRVSLNRIELYEGTVAQGGEWSQTTDQLTITKIMNTGNRIQINFF
jgi:CRISPR/Cas system CMR subunit Cmr4 (Cas7 group RAMP superfamily)